MYAQFPQTSGGRPLSVATTICPVTAPASVPASGPRVACRCDHADQQDLTYSSIASNRQASAA